MDLPAYVLIEQYQQKRDAQGFPIAHNGVVMHPYA
jgi:hypothetical protein